jgi:nucleoside-diphosphate-sugar epimerase
LAAWCSALSHTRKITLIGDGETRRDFIYVGDATAAIIASLQATPGVYNVGGGQSWSLREALAVVEEVTGREAEVSRRPRRDVDVPATHLDISLIRRETGWEPRTPLRGGLSQMWRWITDPSKVEPPGRPESH